MRTRLPGLGSPAPLRKRVLFVRWAPIVRILVGSCRIFDTLHVVATSHPPIPMLDLIYINMMLPCHIVSSLFLVSVLDSLCLFCVICSLAYAPSTLDFISFFTIVIWVWSRLCLLS